MRKNLVVALLIAVMVGAFAGTGQAAVIYADSVTGSGVGNPSAMLGAPNSDFTTLDSGGIAYLTFGGYFQDRPTGADFVLYFSSPENTEPLVYVSARNINGSWVNLDFVSGVSNIRTYEIPGIGTEYYDMISLTAANSLNGWTGSGVAQGGIAPVPEPGTMMLLGSGLVGLAAYGRKKFRK